MDTKISSKTRKRCEADSGKQEISPHNSRARTQDRRNSQRNSQEILVTLSSWPRAIAHVDADAFFASVEQALNPKLKGKPVITGTERGIVTATSYEAKALGIKRGVPLHEVKKICPECIFISSNYETYSIFSKRIFEIMRRFTPEVEEYSIDEAFADLTGLRRLYRSSYPKIGEKIQETVHKELGITVSVGISLSKNLSKLCSKFKKPVGLTAISGRMLHRFLPEIDIAEVWGIGPNTTALLRKYNIHTAYDFVKRPKSFAEKLMGKIGTEIWLELSGHYIYKIDTEQKRTYATITRSKTFTPPSNDPRFVFAQAIRNLESACAKARRYNLAAKGLALFIKRSDFRYYSAESKLTHASASPVELAGPLRKMFDKIFRHRNKYRTTGIVLTDLINSSQDQLPLFGNTKRLIKLEKINTAIDEINSRFGRHAVTVSDTLHLNLSRSRVGIGDQLNHCIPEVKMLP